MSVEQYSDDVIVVAIADGPSNFKVRFRDTFETRQAAISELAPQDAY